MPLVYSNEYNVLKTREQSTTTIIFDEIIEVDGVELQIPHPTSVVVVSSDPTILTPVLQSNTSLVTYYSSNHCRFLSNLPKHVAIFYCLILYTIHTFVRDDQLCFVKLCLDDPTTAISIQYP